MNSDKENNKDKQSNQNYEGDDLIFSGSGCFDDEDECANYADAGSGYDDSIITPVYVPIKPTPISQPKTNSNSKNNKNKMNSNKQRSKCSPPALEEQQANRVQRTEDDDNEEDDEEDDEDCGSGYEPVGSNSEETTERSSIDNQINNNEVYPYQLSTEQSNVINPVTIEEDDKSILFTSQPIPPPASELEKISSEFPTRRPPPPPKRPGGHIEVSFHQIEFYF